MKTVKLRIKTPADASAVEGALLKTAHAGHWHDAEVRVGGDEILVSYREERISGFRENRTEALLLAPRARIQI